MLLMPVQQPAREERGSVMDSMLEYLLAQSYSREHALNVISRLHAHRQLFLRFRDLVETKREPWTEKCHGITYAYLRTKQGMRPVNALLTLAWIEADPVQAIKALREGIR